MRKVCGSVEHLPFGKWGKGSAAAGPNTSWKRFTKSKIPSFISHANQTSDLRIYLQIIFSLFMANRCQQFFLGASIRSAEECMEEDTRLHSLQEPSEKLIFI